MRVAKWPRVMPLMMRSLTPNMLLSPCSCKHTPALQAKIEANCLVLNLHANRMKKANILDGVQVGRKKLSGKHVALILNKQCFPERESIQGIQKNG